MIVPRRVSLERRGASTAPARPGPWALERAGNPARASQYAASRFGGWAHTGAGRRAAQHPTPTMRGYNKGARTMRNGLNVNATFQVAGRKAPG